MKTKRIIKIIILILWMLVIFLLSNQTGSESTSLSDKVICSIFSDCHQDIYSFIVRKLAHFILYFILGIFSYINFKNDKEGVLNAIILCIIYAFTDEIHQMFVTSRSSEVRDIIIDSLGSISSILLIYKLKKRD